MHKLTLTLVCTSQRGVKQTCSVMAIVVFVDDTHL